MHSNMRGVEPPQKLGPYRLDERLGSGGMGVVWRAWDERLERWVALKQVRDDVPLRHSRERFHREARATARLNHPSIAQVYDILDREDGDWIVMELVEGTTLRELLATERTLAPARAVGLGRDIVDGLAHAHANGILHRDLKASNVMVAASGQAKILDFGLAKEILREGGGPTPQDLTGSVPGTVMGTPYAMSPEQVLGEPLDVRSDLFSLGSLLYEMLTGAPPFSAETAALSIARVLEFTPPPLHESHPALPATLCDLVDWLLRKAAHERPRSATEVLAALTQVDLGSGRQVKPAVRRPLRPALEDSTDATLFDAPRRPPSVEGLPASGEELLQSGRGLRTVTIVCLTLLQAERRAEEAEPHPLEIPSAADLDFEHLARQVASDLGGSLSATLDRTLWLSFGHPQAHEDDPERAVQAAREIQAKVAALPVAADRHLAVRAGVHTGLAEVASHPKTGQILECGDTFDLALAVQGQAAPGGIAVSAASLRLLRGAYSTAPLPEIYLRDLATPVAVFELGPREESASRFPEPALVNREAEMKILLDRFELARSGSGQAVLLCGEAGIGKSRLVRALAEATRPAAPVWLLAHGSALAQNTPLAPILQLLTRSIVTRQGGDDSGEEEKLRLLEQALDDCGLSREEHAPLLGPLLSVDIHSRYSPLVLSPEARRKRTHQSIVALFAGLASARPPVVLVMEDLHWVDPTTLDWLGLLLAEIPAHPLFLVTTFRPEFAPPWRHQTFLTQLNLGGLSEAHARQLIDRVTEGRPLSAAMDREIVARTEGVPLFVEEMTKAVLEGDTSLNEPTGVPFSLGGSLLARLDRLGDAKAVAQLASVIGRTFSLELLEALAWIKGAALQAALGRLVQAEILHRRGAAQGTRYLFKHALLQDAAYLSLLASDRQQLHLRLAHLIQEEFPAVAEAEPELMAHHCERGGLTAEAIDFLLGAGFRALQRSAPREAESHLRRGLVLLSDLSVSSTTTGRELSLRLVLLAVIGATQGWGASSVAENAERCAALSREVGDLGRLMPSLFALWTYHVLRSDRKASIELADEIAQLAETKPQRYVGVSAQVIAVFYSGRFAECLSLAEQAETLYAEPNLLPELAQTFGDESSVLSHAYQVWSLWILGRPQAAIRKCEAMMAAVEALRSPFQIVFAQLFEMILWRELREPERVAVMAERLLTLSREQEFPYFIAVAHCGTGWATALRGDLANGASQIQHGLDLHVATESLLTWGYYLSYLLDVFLLAGRYAEGLAASREALRRSETQFDVFFDAELHRMEGEFLRATGEFEAAEAAFTRSLDLARRQRAPSFELRAARSQVLLLADQGRAQEALPALATALESFSEGLATRDLTEGRELLARFSPAAE